MLTKICSVVEIRALESCLPKDTCQVTDRSTIKALSFCYNIDVIKHLKKSWTWLVDGTHYCSTTFSQRFEVWDHLYSWWTVQSTEKKSWLYHKSHILRCKGMRSRQRRCTACLEYKDPEWVQTFQHAFPIPQTFVNIRPILSCSIHVCPTHIASEVNSLGLSFILVVFYCLFKLEYRT